MVKKGKKGKGKGRKGRARSKAPKTRRLRKAKTPIAATVGGLISAYNIELQPPTPGYVTPVYEVQINAIKTMDPTKIVDAAKYTWVAVKDKSGPALVGLALSYGGDLPVVGPLYKGLVKTPVDRLIGKLERKLTGKKPRTVL